MYVRIGADVCCEKLANQKDVFCHVLTNPDDWHYDCKRTKVNVHVVNTEHATRNHATILPSLHIA